MAIVTDEDILKQLNGGVTPPKPKPLGSDIPDDVLDQLNSPAPLAAPKMAPAKAAPRQASPVTPVAPSSSPLFKFTQAGDQQSVMGIASPNDRKAGATAKSLLTDIANAARTTPATVAAGVERGAGSLQVAASQPKAPGYLPGFGYVDPATGGRVPVDETGALVDRSHYSKGSPSIERSGLGKLEESEMVMEQIKRDAPMTSKTAENILRQGPYQAGAMLPTLPLAAIPVVGPEAAVQLMAQGSGADAIRQGRQKGLTNEEIDDYKAKTVGPEYLGEQFSIRPLLSLLSRKAPFFKAMAPAALAEVSSELGTSHFQYAADKAYEQPGLSKAQRDEIYRSYLDMSAQRSNPKAMAEWSGMMKDTATVTAGMVGTMGAAGAVHRAAGKSLAQSPAAEPATGAPAVPPLPPDADPARVAKLAAIMEADTPEMAAQRMTARQNPAPEMPNQVTDAAILDQLNAGTEPTAAPATDAPLIDQLDFASNEQPFNPNQLNFEIGLMKNPNTSKTAVLIPKSSPMTGADVNALAKGNGFRAIRSGEDFYIYDPKQIKETELRRQAKAGKNGQALGYGTDGVPADGIPYAVDVDGKGTVSPAEILDLRDQGRLGFAGVAPDMDAAVAKIREMGRDDAEVRGVPELGEQLAQRDAAKQAPPAGIPSISREDAIAAKQQVVTELAGVDPESDRAAQLQVQLDQYNKIIGGEAEYRDFQPPQSAVDLYRETETAREKLAAIVGDKRTSEIVEEIDTRLVEGDTAAGREGRGPGGRGAAFYAEMRDELQKSLDVVDNEAATSGTLLNRQRAKKQEAAEARTMEAMRRMDNQEANELAALLEQKQVSPDQVAKIEDALESGDNDAVLDAMYEAATIAKDKLKIAPPVKPRTAPKLDRQKDDAIVAISEPQVSGDDTTRAVLKRLAAPKKFKDRTVQGLVADHGKDTVNALVKQGFVRFPGQGRAEITKQGEAWLAKNPEPRTAAQQEKMQKLEKKRKRSDKEESALAQLKAMAEPAFSLSGRGPSLNGLDTGSPLTQPPPNNIGARGPEKIRDFVGSASFMDELDKLLHIPRQDATLFSPPQNVASQSSSVKGHAQRMTSDIEFLSNILKSPAFLEKGYSGLDVKTQGLVQTHMLRAGANKQVLNTVVKLIPVDVVDVLGSNELSPKVLFHNPTMLKKALSPDLIQGVSLLAPADSLVKALTLAGAIENARAASGDLTRVSQDLLAADGAVDGDSASSLVETLDRAEKVAGGVVLDGPRAFRDRDTADFTVDDNHDDKLPRHGGKVKGIDVDRITQLIEKTLPGGKVSLNIVETIVPPANAESAFAAHGVKSGKIAGMHQATITADGVRSIITLAMDGATTRDGIHEVFHAGEALGIITAKDLSILQRAYPDKDGIASSERRADAFADYVAGRGKKPVLSAKLIFDKIRRFLNRLAAVLKGQGWRNADDVFADLLGGKLKRNAQGVADPSAGVQFTYVKARDNEQGAFSDLTDKQAKVEIDDSGAKIKNRGDWLSILTNRDGESARLSQILDHPQLYERYPETADITVKLSNPHTGKRLGASYNPDTKTIVIGRDERDFKEIALHEIQHAIQEQEGFAKGGNLGEIAKRPMSYLTPKQLADAKALPGYKTANNPFNFLDEYAKNVLPSPMNIYQRHAGEEESRRTSSRADMPADERMGKPYGRTDIANAQDLIVKMEGGKDVEFSLSKPLKDRNPQALRSALTLHPKVQSLVASIFAEGRNVTRWQRSVGTMYHTAEDLAAKGMPQFREVFRKGQEFLNDVSALAVAAESLAPDIFPKLGTGKGIFHNISKADAKAIAEPLFDGTLYGGADPTRGRVFNPIELEVRYGLNTKQIELYQQARAATDQSLDDMARSLIAKNAKTVKVSFDRDMSLADMAAEVSAAIQERVDDMQASLDQAEADFQTNSAKLEGKELQAATRAHDQFVRPQKAAIELHKGAVKNIDDLLKKTESLKKHGYFPLMRFGEHTVTVRDQNGETQFFSMYESIFAARNAEHKLKREFPGMEVTRGGVNKEKHKLYAGMNIEALQLFAEHLGADETAPYQEYLKEAMNNRSAMKRLIHRKGTEGYSEDAVRTLASFIISNARHASTQYNLHDMREMIQAIPEESQWDVQAKAVRLYEYLTKPTEEASALRGYLFFHYLGGSLASGITNMTQPLMMTTPYLMTKANPAKVAAAMTAAAKDSFTDPAKVKGPLGIALRRAESEGITAPQEIHQLTAVASNKLFASSGVANATMKAWGGFFAAAEAFNRRTTFIAAFRLAKDAGKADGAAYTEASEAVTATQGIYNKGNRPEWGRGIVGAPLFTFKQYGVMYLELYNRLPVRQKAIMLGLLALMAGLEGLPFAEDAEDVMDTVGQWLGYSTNTKRFIDEQAEKALGKKGADLALRGLSSVLPIDVHGRLGMQNLIPGTSYLKQSEIDRGRDVKEFFGPLGGLFDSLTTALGLLVQGLPGRAALAASPRAVQGYAQGIEMAATGAGHDRQGRKTVEVDKLDAFAKFVGFNPSKVASESRVKGSNMQDLNLLRVRKQEIVNQWAYGIANNDQGEVEAAKQKLREWNQKNPEWRMTTEKLKQSIKNKARALRSSSKDRFLKSVPREQRRRIADEMESDG
jgi:hypothetical protein